MKIKSNNNSEITTLPSDSDKFTKLIEEVKASNVGKDIYLFSCKNDLLSDVDEYYGFKVVHLPESKLFPEQNNKIYIMPVEPDRSIKQAHYDYEIAENETNEFEAGKKLYETKEEIEALKKYLEEMSNE